jgi:hypothetical protein
LRELKDASGRTLRQLARETGYSSSSWERYLGGRSLPPRGAVEELVRIAGGDAVRVLASLEMAADAWKARQDPGRPEAAGEGDAPAEPGTGAAEEPTGGADAAVLADGADGADEPPVTGPADGGPRPRRRFGTGWRGLVTLGGGAVLGAAITLLVVQTSQGAAPCTTAAPVVHKPTYHSAYSKKAGKWYAGNSATSTKQVVVDMFGPDVAELQCLLQRIGITPGGIDGNFGPLTELAVIQAQKHFHLDVDGQVGPLTWAALRR